VEPMTKVQTPTCAHFYLIFAKAGRVKVTHDDCQERRTLDSPGLGYVTRSLRPSSPVGVFLLTAGLRERGGR
jgi:hypothetical protein